MNPIKEIILTGNAYQRGLQHGQAMAASINDFIKDGRARINKIREFALDESILQQQLKEHGAILKLQLPEIAMELQGLAAGANIAYEDALLLQYRVELMAYKDPNILEGDCTSVSVKKQDEVITGQTIDLPGNMTELGCVFRIKPSTTGGPEILMYSFAGLLGYMGMNSYGLTININMVVSDDWQPGVSPYLLVRHLLTLGSVDECLQELKRITRSSSRSFLISDKSTMVNVEFTATAMSVIEQDHLLYHTNHFLDENLAAADKIHFLFRNSSVKRLKLIKQLLPVDEINITPAALFDIFSDHSLYPIGICAHSEGNIRRSETVAAVVMEPATFSLHARKGNACTGVTESFVFDAAPICKT